MGGQSNVLEALRYSVDGDGAAVIAGRFTRPVSELDALVVSGGPVTVADEATGLGGYTAAVARMARTFGGVVVSFGEGVDSRATRVSLGMRFSSEASFDQAGTEDLYGIVFVDEVGGRAVQFEKLGRLTYAANGVAEQFNPGQVEFVPAQTCSFVSTGRLLALTGGISDVRTFPLSGTMVHAGAEIPDVGKFRGILRLPAADGSGDYGVYPVHQKWK